MLRLIPGLEQAEFVRFGMVHRNTYVNGPTVLDETWQVRRRPIAVLRRPDVRRRRLRRVGGVGLAGRAERGAAREGRAASRASAHDGHRRAGVLRVARRPGALRAVEHHLRHHGAARPVGCAPRGKVARKLALAERALGALDAWQRGAAGDAVDAGTRDTLETPSRDRAPQSVSPVSAAQSQCVGAHRARVRERSLAVSDASPPRPGRQGPRARAKPSRSRGHPAVLGELHRRGSRGRRPRASSRRSGRFCATCAGKASSTTTRARSCRRRSAKSGCPRICRRTR